MQQQREGFNSTLTFKKKKKKPNLRKTTNPCRAHVHISAVLWVNVPGNMPDMPVNHDVP